MKLALVFTFMPRSTSQNLLLFLSCLCLVPASGSASDDAERKLIAQKAEAGDGAAAYSLYNDMTIDRDASAVKDAEPWLLLAVKLNNADAERVLATLIQLGEHDYKGFGANRHQAVESLLKAGAQNDGPACDDLASAYESGVYDGEVFEPKDLVQARAYYLRGAQFNIEFCWFPLAHLLHEGLGGPRDDRSAYS